MTESRDKPTLDELLARWDEAHSPVPGDLQALHERISLAITAPHSSNAVPPVLSPSRPSQVAALTIAALMAAGIVAAIVVTRGPKVDRGKAAIEIAGNGREQALVPSEARLNRELVRGYETLFRESSELFDARLSWIAQSGNEVRLGLNEKYPVANRPAAGSSHLVVRLAFAEKRSPSNTWNVTWTMDVILRAEETAEVDLASFPARHVALWALVLEDGTVAVESDVRMMNPALGWWSGLSVQGANDVSTLAIAPGGDGERRVFQSIAVLPRWTKGNDRDTRGLRHATPVRIGSTLSRARQSTRTHRRGPLVDELSFSSS